MRLFRVTAFCALSLAGCDMGTYTPGLHHGGNDASMTGSHLEGAQTDAQDNASDPSLRQVPQAMGGTR